MTGEGRLGYGLYLHSPFCATKCPYCDFYSGVFPASRIPAAVAAMVREMEEARADARVAPLIERGLVTSFFFGGGTPSHLPESELARLLTAIRSCFSLAPGAEVTVECNPESFTADKASRLRELGVERVSLGVQSLDDGVLAGLGRPHDARSALAAARAARELFPQVSYDLILAAPGLTQPVLADSLDRLLDLGPDHLSAYGLTIEAGTPFSARVVRGDLVEATDDEFLAEDELVESRAARAGLLRYEVSNYARPGAECRHNLDIWRGGYYLGLGPSAHSYLPCGDHGLRRANVADLDQYVSRLEGGESPVATAEIIGREQAMAERFLLGMRTTEGVELGAFADRFGIPVEAAAGSELAALEAGGFVIRQGGRLAVTPAGRAVLDAVVGRLTSRLAAA